MVFSYPLMLLGGLAVGIPIALHFFFRSRYRTIPWAAMKFLLTSIEQTSRRLRFQELLLLVLRCLVVAILAMALAQPGCRVTPGGGASGDPVDAVFLFDVSFSMGASDGPVDRLQRAKTEALAILNRLPHHSTVRVITCADRPEHLGPRSPGNLDQVRSLIEDLKLTSLTSDLYPGILAAEEVLQKSETGNTELYLFSDMQKNAWDQQAGPVAAKLKEMHEKTSIYLVRCGDSRRTLKNAAIVGITPQSGVPRPGERVGFAVLVRNTGSDEVKDLKLTLSVDGDDKKAETQQIDRLPPGETRAVTLAAKLEKPGLRLLTAQLDHDDLPGDNRFDQVVLVRDTVNVLIIDGGINEREPAKSSSFYLELALTPVKDTERAKYYLQTAVYSPRLAAPALLAKQDLCILVNVPLHNIGKQADALPGDFLGELAKFVRQGKGLIVYSGENVVAEPYNRLLGEKHGLLPLPVKGIVDYSEKEKQIKLNRGSADSPAYLIFKEDNLYQKMNDITVLKAVELDESAQGQKLAKSDEKLKATDKEALSANAQSPVTVALRYSNGLPAVVTKKVGGGEVVFITSSVDLGYKKDSPDMTWTDWSLNWSYVPFVMVTVSQLLQEQTQVFNSSAGKQVDWRLPREGGPEAYQRFMKSMAPDLTTDEDKTVMKWASNGFATQNFQLRRPDGTLARLGYPEGVREQPVVRIADFTTAGIYRLGFAPTGQGDLDKILDKKVSLPFAVIADLRDSENLESYGEQQLDERLGFRPIHRTAGVEQVGADDIGTEALRRRDLTPWFLFLVLILAAGEVALAWVCSRAW